MAASKTQAEAEARRAAIQQPLDELVAPDKKKLYDDRVAMLPDDVRKIVVKPEKERTVAEQKIADDYYPVLRIDPDKFLPTMTAADRKKYEELRGQLDGLRGSGGGRRSRSLCRVLDRRRRPDPAAAKELSSSPAADPDRPEKNHEAQPPGWPFEPSGVDFRDGRRGKPSARLADCAAESAVRPRGGESGSGSGILARGWKKHPNDFGTLGGLPSNPELLTTGWLPSSSPAGSA